VQRGKAKGTDVRFESVSDQEDEVKLRQHAHVGRWFGTLAFVGLLVWRWDPTGFAGRQTTTKPQAVAADFGQWTFVGPTHLLSPITPYSGRVTSIAVDPADPNHWLVGAAQGGVWDTRDAGATWQPRTDGQPSLAIGAIAFSPTSPGVVYVGTGEANFCSWCYAGAGMLRSNDSGSTWTVVNTSTFAHSRRPVRPRRRRGGDGARVCRPRLGSGGIAAHLRDSEVDRWRTNLDTVADGPGIESR